MAKGKNAKAPTAPKATAPKATAPKATDVGPYKVEAQHTDGSAAKSNGDNSSK